MSLLFEVTFAKMSANLVVHKFETGINYKSLQITIEDGDNGSFEVRYGEWIDGKNQYKKTDSEKSSRLIVKIVSGCEYNNLNLDSCAREIDNSDIHYNNGAEMYPFNDGRQNLNLLCFEMNESEKTSSSAPFYVTEGHNSRSFYVAEENNYQMSFNNYSEDEIRGNSHNLVNQSVTYQQDSRNTVINNTDTPISPLEYSLEKVKENNARIMENIHMLNRTLNYTKKEEILDIVCPKSMRFPCNTCGKCFVYETGLKRHYSMRHSISEMQPRWQVVWTCTECFQVWPRQDLAIKHSNKCCKTSNTDYVREIKTSSLLQCEFCEKVYTSIPRLLRHSKIHTTANNYECNACESTFLSYKSAEQHWLLCPWLKMCYSFSLPKMLLCNACDRKFKNYEQLYNHRYGVYICDLK